MVQLPLLEFEKVVTFFAMLEGKMIVDMAKMTDDNINELKKMRKEMLKKEDTLQDKFSSRKSKVRKEFETMLDQCQGQMQSLEMLETRIGRVGQTAIRIGEQLESLHKQRERAIHAERLVGQLECVKEVLYSRDPKEKVKGAIIARQLMLATLEDECDKKFKESAQKLFRDYENNLIQQFEKATKENDTRQMKTLAEILFEYNGGKSCIQAYFNQKEFLNEAIKMTPKESIHFNDGQPISIELNQTEKTDPRLEMLYREAKLALEEDLSIIQSIFPRPSMALEYFIQRIFEHPIQIYLESILHSSLSHSKVAYLRCLHQSYIATIEIGKEFDCVLKNHFGDKIYVKINRFIDEIFSPYLEKSKILEYEKDALNTIVLLILSPFQNFINTKQSNKQKGKPLANSNPPNIFKLVNTDCIHQCLRLFSQSIQRITMLVADSKIEEELNKMDSIIEVYDFIKNVMDSIALIEETVKENNLNEKQLTKIKEDFFKELEIWCNSLLNSIVDVHLNQISSILNKQKKTDFKPKDEANVLSIPCSDTCKLITGYLEEVTKAAQANIDKILFVSIFSDLFSSFQDQLLAHIKKFTFTDIGGMLLSKDFNVYYNLAFNLQLKLDVIKGFEMLKDLSNIYIVRPENIKSIIEQGILSSFSFDLILPFVALRSDFHSANVKSLFYELEYKSDSD
ncbi:Exocyst complex component Sec10-like domain-containing protein [Rozella allomycis CSF55]|uniref:Exocyst complex component Sec10-like domain-containing protein n=1 Tax=Rozella allomycis (strain CSF55) TaxID=988480 RepID=A0A075B2I0_ROZAC|nr:Exocyst complex component Sec10-like domain-containing protein [Rozella allomycis CSF55]|eukprot:EPZ36562.1 Exocyst complex component Sec10-like domain-containing protein [Rozella allomycis CSF55]